MAANDAFPIYLPNGQVAYSERDLNNWYANPTDANGRPYYGSVGKSGSPIVTINGQQFYRVGETAEGSSGAGSATYDPQYGTVIPLPVAQQWAQENQKASDAGFWNGIGPFGLAAGGLAAFLGPTIAGIGGTGFGGAGGIPWVEGPALSELGLSAGTNMTGFTSGVSDIAQAFGDVGNIPVSNANLLPEGALTPGELEGIAGGQFPTPGGSLLNSPITGPLTDLGVGLLPDGTIGLTQNPAFSSQMLNSSGQVTGGVPGAGGGSSGNALTDFLKGLGMTPASLLTGLGQGLLGAFGANAQADAYRDVADKYLGIGAPYRDRLNASYQPGFDLISQPGYGDAFDRIADISARGYSAKGFGNPFDSPTAKAGILSDVWNQGYLPALTNYRGQLGQFGGLGLNTSGAASLQGAQGAGGMFDAIGAGLGTALNPTTSLDDLLSRLGTKLSVGGPI